MKKKAEVQDQYPLSLNPVQKANDHIQDRNRSIGPIKHYCLAETFGQYQNKEQHLQTHGKNNIKKVLSILPYYHKAYYG